MNEDLMKEIKFLLPVVAIVAIAVGGYYGVRGYIASSKAAASNAFATSQTVEELEGAVADYGSSAAGKVLELRLAKAYYDKGEYQAALERYQALAAVKEPQGFADIAVVGCAASLEALGKYDEALKGYDDYAAANTNAYLTLTAQLGSARVTALKGDKAKALATLATLKSALADDAELDKARIEAAEKLIGRIATK